MKRNAATKDCWIQICKKNAKYGIIKIIEDPTPLVEVWSDKEEISWSRKEDLIFVQSAEKKLSILCKNSPLFIKIYQIY